MRQERRLRTQPASTSHRAGAATALILILTCTAQGATLTVGIGAGYDYGTVQAAINAAKAGDTVVVAPGTYKEKLRFYGRNIVLISTDPNSPRNTRFGMFIEGREPTVTFSGSEGTGCILRGFLIRGGHGTDAGGIAGNGTRAIIADCIIESNSSKGMGGGMSNCHGLIERCVIQDNSADTYGGGLYNCDGIIRDCTIRNNSCGSSSDTGLGGGLYGCDGTIENCDIRWNRTTGNGGGLNNCDGIIRNCQICENRAGDEDSPLDGGGLYGCDGQVSNCMITGNTAASGGGLFNCYAQITGCTIQGNTASGWHGGAASGCNSVMQCTISGNSARGYGGGLFSCKSVTGCTIRANTTVIYAGGGLSQCDSVANCIITDNQSGAGGGGLDQCKRVINCVVAGNRAAEDGGGLRDCLEVLNCTITGNLSTGRGGGVYYGSYLGTVGNCILWDNAATTAGQAYVAHSANPPADQGHWSLCLAYSDIQGGREGTVVEPNSQLVWDSSNIDEDPRFVRSGRWLGPQTWQSGDYRLMSSSPCVDAGDPNGDYSGQTDIDGDPRVFGSCVDMGADECATAAALFADLKISGPNDVSAQSSAQFHAVAYYTDGSAIDVTQFAVWSSEPADFANVNESGLLTVQNVSRTIDVVVQAKYTDQEVTLIATKTVRCVPLPPPPPAVTYHVDCVIGNDDNKGLMPGSAFATIQRGIDATKDGDIVLVHPGVYTEEVRFKGKAITLRSAGDAAILQNPGDFAVAFYYGEGPDSILKNFIVRNSLTGVFIVAGSPTIRNVTVVGNEYGVEAYVGAEPDISNSILWGNVIADLVGCTARFSCLMQTDPGPTNIRRDPLFADPNRGDYHLRSTRGRYWPEHDIWVLDNVTSPCLDAGDPSDPVDSEPVPHGGRINMGAHGGTSTASLSPLGPVR